MDLAKNIEDFNLVFLDLETTGLDVFRGDAICEIGAFKIKERQEIDKFHTLVNPKRSMPQEAFKIHQISDEDLKDAPRFEDVADSFFNFLNNSVILAYNVEFDLGFVNYEFKNMNKPTIDLPVIDILSMARKSLKLSRYNLSAIAEFFNIEYTGRMHRALDDALVASKVFFRLRDMLKEGQLDKLGDFVSIFGLNNEIFRLKEEPKVCMVQEAIKKQQLLRTRYFSYQNTMEKENIKPINLSKENKYFFLWYENKYGKNVRINLNHILDVETV